jgi:membrane-anchored mycosin MYCP
VPPDVQAGRQLLVSRVVSPRVLGSVAALSLASVVLVASPDPAQAAPDGNDCQSVNATDTEKDPPETRSAPLAALQIARAQAIVKRRTGTGDPGAGVVVAVVDSGVDDRQLKVDGHLRDGKLKFYHGTAMAGVIAGPPQNDGVGAIGIAPGARIYDARFYDTTNSEDGLTPTDDRLVDALRAIVPKVGRGAGEISIVTVALTVDKSTPRLKAAIDAVTDAGAIVVASSGNRVSETASQTEDDDDAPDDTGYEYGEDVTKYPAGYAATNPRVVSVGTTTDRQDQTRPSGLLSSTIDVVVPTFGAVSYAINRSTCSFYASSTSVAAAEVSGILALLRAAFPKDSPEQLIARLEVTATGVSASGSGMVDKYRGRGIVQPVEALTRPLLPNREGVVGPGPQPPPPVAPAALPASEPDVLRSTRHNAVWWGLFGGGALIVALLLRPVLSRRRARS